MNISKYRIAKEGDKYYPECFVTSLTSDIYFKKRYSRWVRMNSYGPIINKISMIKFIPATPELSFDTLAEARKWLLEFSKEPIGVKPTITYYEL